MDHAILIPKLSDVFDGAFPWSMTHDLYISFELSLTSIHPVPQNMFRGGVLDVVVKTVMIVSGFVWIAPLVQTTPRHTILFFPEILQYRYVRSHDRPRLFRRNCRQTSCWHNDSAWRAAYVPHSINKHAQLNNNSSLGALARLSQP